MHKLTPTTANDEFICDKSFQNATIFEFGYAVGPRQFEVRQIRFHVSSPKGGSEFEAATFIKRGMRKEVTVPVNQLVVIHGWGHPKLETYTIQRSGNTMYHKEKFQAFSNKWDDLLIQHLASYRPRVELIIDGRNRPKLTRRPERGSQSAQSLTHISSTPEMEIISESGDSMLLADIRSIESNETIGPTIKQALLNARVGQGKFGSAVRKLWHDRCAVTGSSTKGALEASHIKPWTDSNDKERLDPNNGILLTANLHKLFDAGLISFEDSGKLLVSSRLSSSEQEIFGVVGKKLSKKPSPECANYLSYQRAKFLACLRRCA